MLESLKVLLRRLRAWMAENERAHRDAKPDSCCSSPSAIYAARRQRGKGDEHD
ncbi:hypothetical protein [Aromatoleum evansii]|uniref:Uncharacterized protein n=1 Tax=Aromatoleum evansii TaxID=59406 RepID=A0ABZ1AFS2_AROEV|nr:hypothetical protein [Aromatoleum evansii]NMG28931.1 hypothetical protein [Aromatoleum evansii]WRL44725.1 hypothetical protein U5817_16085 [Aromatoleum evansii]